MLPLLLLLVNGSNGASCRVYLIGVEHSAMGLPERDTGQIWGDCEGHSTG